MKSPVYFFVTLINFFGNLAMFRGTIHAYNGETGAVFEISIPVSR